MLVHKSEFFELKLLCARIGLQLLNVLLFSLDVTLQIRVLLFQCPNFMLLFGERAQPLRSSQHDGCVCGKSGQCRNCCNRPKERTHVSE